MIKEASVRAHTNIALIKYWGKQNEEYILPMNSSLSLTLDAFYTETTVRFDTNLERDVFYLDGVEQTGNSLDKLQPILNGVRKQAGFTTFAHIESTNHVPTAAGLASSASGMAALAGAASIAAGLRLTESDLSRLARRGSGSASRSIYGGFVEWQKGNSDRSSYAIQIREADFDVGMVFLVVNKEKKKMSSREGMKRTVETSPYYEEWVETAERDLIDMKHALYKEDFQEIGKLTERSAMKMHATTLGANPPFTYWEPQTIEAMQLVDQLREEGIPAYYTMDAGPNVKVLCKFSDAKKIQQRAAEVFGEENCIISKPGPGLSVIEEIGGSKERIPYRTWLKKEDKND